MPCPRNAVPEAGVGDAEGSTTVACSGAQCTLPSTAQADIEPDGLGAPQLGLHTLTHPTTRLQVVAAHMREHLGAVLVSGDLSGRDIGKARNCFQVRDVTFDDTADHDVVHHPAFARRQARK